MDWAVENGITKGISDTTFSSNMTCSRAQFVTFLWRSEKSPADIRPSIKAADMIT